MKKVICNDPNGWHLTPGKIYEADEYATNSRCYTLKDDFGSVIKPLKSRFQDVGIATPTIASVMNASQSTPATTNTIYPKQVKCIDNGSISGSSVRLTLGKIYTANESKFLGKYAIVDDLGNNIHPHQRRFVDADAIESKHGEVNDPYKNRTIPKQPEEPQQPYLSTLKDAMLYDMQMKKPKFEGQALAWHKEGRCQQCGELGRFHMSTPVCSKHGPY